MKVKLYKIYCTSDSRWERWFLKEDAPAPTTCPTNTIHNVDLNSVSVERVIEDKEPAKTEDNILYVKDHPASIAYEMCDRDILVTTATHDARAIAYVAGASSPNGDIIWAASTPGRAGNRFTVEYTAGASGAGNEDRPLDAEIVYGSANALVVTYGTDGNGNPIVPTAQQVHDMLWTKNDILFFVAPTLAGDGSSLVQVTGPHALAGGTSPSVDDIKIDPITYAKSQWCELQQVGVFKLDADNYVECPENEVSTEACLSIWRYLACDHSTGAPIGVEIKNGLLLVDASLSDSLEHQSFAVGAPQVPAALGGQVVQFDAYLKYYKGQVLGATSPQAKLLDPSLAVAAAELRIYIYYPKGTQNTHVLRLVTYRPPGTF